MHGKILRYSSTTGSGVIINASKKIFELRKESWHDGRNRPAVGMYVEFRTSENGHVVTDARASKYQNFTPDSLIREIDFWKSKTDEELKNKESELRSQVAQKIYAQTNYLKLKDIETNTTVQNCIKDFFMHELKSIEFLKSVDQTKLQPILKYSLCKRFIDKALDFLTFTDRKLTMDMFYDNLQRIGNLEYSHIFFSKNELVGDKVFEEAFLDFQYSYKGALKASVGLRDRILQLENKIRISSQEMRSIRMKIDAKKGDANELNEKITKIRTNTNKAHEEIKVLRSGLENLENLANEFKDKNFKIFDAVFKKTVAMLKTKIEEALNVSATQLDYKIWELGMASVSIKNVFFKHEINEPYCMMTFLGQMIKKLDRSKIISPHDQAMYKYYYNHQTKYVKKFLIFSNNQKVEVTIKIQVMSESKNYNVVVTKKDSQFFASMNKEQFQGIYIDTSNLDDASLKQILSDVKSSKFNADTKCIVLTKEQVSLMKD